MIKKAQWYILRNLTGPFLGSIGTIMFIFLLQFLMKYLDRLVGKGLSIWVILELIILNLAWMLVLAVPMGVLISTLMVFGQMSGDHEITSLKAAGVHPFKLMVPVIVLGFILSGSMFWFNDYVLPDANYKAKTLFRDIRNKKPTFELESGRFSDLISGFSIKADHMNRTSGMLYDVTIFDYSNNTRQQVINADSGIFNYSPDNRFLIMTLYYGQINEVNFTNFEPYQIINFNTNKIVFNATGFGFERSEEGTYTRGNREMSIAMMEAVNDSIQSLIDRSQVRIIDRLNRTTMSTNTAAKPGTQGSSEPVETEWISLSGLSSPDISRIKFNTLNEQVRIRNFIDSELLTQRSLQEDIDAFTVEIHKKYALPLACLVFVFVGLPLGIQAKRGGIGVGAGLSLVFFLVYWAFLLGGEKLADRSIIAPEPAMWSANVLTFLIGLVLTGRMFTDGNWRALKKPLRIGKK